MYQILILPFILLSIYNQSDFLIGGDHAIYLSVVEVDHKDLGDKASIKIKVFTNDLEDALMNTYHERIPIGDEAICTKGKIKIEGYFSKHFAYTINEKKAVLVFERCETNGDATWLHFQIACPSKWNKINVTADYLMELFPTQSNVVSIQHGSEKRFININKSKMSEAITF